MAAAIVQVMRRGRRQASRPETESACTLLRANADIDTSAGLMLSPIAWFKLDCSSKRDRSSLVLRSTEFVLWSRKRV
jgi:hypothetical protein